MTKLIGRVASNVNPEKNHGFISLRSVRTADGERHGLDTRKDIFIHQSACSTALRPGMEVEFYAYRDQTRENAYRAEDATETVGSRLVGLEQGGIELHLQNTQGGRDARALEHSSVFVSWCLSEALAARVKILKLEHKIVRLLLVWWPITSPDYHDSDLEERKLVDLNDPMAFLPFGRGGLHRIVALLVWGDSEASLKDLYLKRTDDRWSTGVIYPNGAGIALEYGDRNSRTNKKIFWQGTGLVQPEVPETLFAKKPWDYKWLTFLNSKPLKDECDARRRRLLYAYHIQVVLAGVIGVIIALSWAAALVSVLLLVSFGFTRGINYRPLRVPWDEAFWGVWRNLDESTSFAFTIKGHRVGLPLAISPGFLAIAAVLTFVTIKTWSWLLFGIFLALFALFWAIVCLVVYWYDSADKQAMAEAKARAEAKAEARYAQQLEAELEMLVCTPGAARLPDVSKLGIGPRTIRFHALALKQRWCRGFARS